MPDRLPPPPLWARLRSIGQRLFGLLRRRAIETDLDAEIETHLQMRAALLASEGLSPAAARDEARRRFGNQTMLKEEARAQELFPRLETVMQDIRYGLRLLRRSPGFTLIATLVLGLGIGLNAAMFSIVDHVLLAPLPFPRADRLYVVSSHAPSLGDTRRTSSGPDFRDYRDQSTLFTGVAAAIPPFSEVWTGDGEPRVLNCASPTQGFFEVLGIHPALGRLFLPNEFHDLGNETLLISWNFWKNQLGGDPNVIGRTLRLENVPSKIVGVLPPLPDIYPNADVWLKLTTEPSWDFMNWRANKFLDVFVRLKPGVTPASAEQELTTIQRRAVGEPADVRISLTPLRQQIVGPVARQLDLLLTAMALVLLVTLFNASAILLARSIRRAPELTMRLGLGASRARIRRQLLVEGLLLSTLGGALGVVVACVAVGAVRHVPISLPRAEGLRLNAPALALTIGLVVVISILFSVLPGMLPKLDLASTLRSGRGESGAAQRSFATLIIAEVACAVVLTVCAGLLLRSLQRVHSVDVGYQPQRVLSAYLRTNYDDPQGFPFWRNIIATADALPGATLAALSDCVPSAKANSATILFSDRANVRGRAPSTEACWISAGYFKTLGVPLVHGRLFTDHDDANGPPVAIINASAARQLFPREDPIGKRIGVDYLALGSRQKDSIPRLREIVGVVSDFRQRGVDLPSSPAIYLPFMQDETYHVLNSMYVFIRGAADDTSTLGNALRMRVQSAYPDQPVERIQVMRQVIATTLARRTYATLLMAGFALLALLLSGLGIYGVVSYVMSQRTREFGIRMALGAQRRDVLRTVLRHGGSMVAAGVLAGSAIALVVSRLLSQLLFETTASDPGVYLWSAAVLAATGIGACLVPALRASRVDPRVALNTQ